MNLSDALNVSSRAATHKKSFQEHINLSNVTQINAQPGSKIRSRLTPNEFRMLDLFCGQGLSAWGYWLSGRFSEIVGVDIDIAHASRYSFDFIAADVLSLDYDFLLSFDFIHASPPCQGYSKVTPKWARGHHPRLINDVHQMLYATGKPYVIENVEGSTRELRPNIALSGHAFGLSSYRRRYFHASTLGNPIREIVRSCPAANVHASANRAEIIESLGLHIINPNALAKMTTDGMLQGIPPVMTQYISARLFNHKIMVGGTA